jgi:hypothetical protein
VNHSTNVLPMPARRRDDAMPLTLDTHRSTPAFERPLHPPSPLDEPFADALISHARKDRQLKIQANLRQRLDQALQTNQLHTAELAAARKRGIAEGRATKFRDAWWAGISIGFLIGGSTIAVAIKAGYWLVVRT